MARKPNRTHVFGIRHHGPGCARSLVHALDELNPECVLVEGPADATEMLRFVADPATQPPVAILCYDEKTPAASFFSPFAEFSPEWQAVSWALRNDREVRFIDLPSNWELAAIRAEIEAREAEQEESEAEEGDEAGVDAEADGDDASADQDAGEQDPLRAFVARPNLSDDEEASLEIRRDPIGALARIAGHEDGDTWWSQLVEEQPNAPSVFAAIEEALTALREVADEPVADNLDWADAFFGPGHSLRERRREAHMRMEVSKALKDFEGEVAAVVGAWHVPALRKKTRKSDDRALLTRAPRVKVAMSWVPWTNTRLASFSGYRAGVRAPNWYRHLWRHSSDASRGAEGLAAGWAVHVGALLREAGDTVSTASLIEATRLSMSVAAIRDVATPAFEDIMDAIVATMCGGDGSVLKAHWHDIYIGSEIGEVGDDTPQNPLQVDLQKLQKRLRMKVSDKAAELSLDLRSNSGGARSALLHRLQLIDVPWGQVTDSGRSRGTFRENWVIRWQPEFAVQLAEAVVYGTTVEAAAHGKAVSDATKSTELTELAALVRGCLNADLEAAARVCIQRLQAVASSSSDIVPSMEAVPSLVEALRYGEARNVPEDALQMLVSSLAAQVFGSLNYACRQLQDEALAKTRSAIQGFDRAMGVLDDDHLQGGWVRALTVLAADSSAMAMLQGFAQRRLYDRGIVDPEETASALALALSPVVSPSEASGWLEGFLNGEGQVLLFDDGLRAVIADWMAGIDSDVFRNAIPMLRRAFSTLDRNERKQLMNRLAGPSAPAGIMVGAKDDTPEDIAAYQACVPLLSTILGWTGADATKEVS